MVAGTPSLFLKQKDKNHPSHKSPDMGPPGYSPSSPAHSSQSKGTIKELKNEPKTQKNEGRQLYYVQKKTKGDQSDDPASGKEDKIGSQHSSNGSAGPDGGDGRGWVGEDMGQTRNRAAQKIEEEVAEMAHAILHVIAEDPQVEHIAQDVEPSAMQKHGGNKGQKKMDGTYIQEELCRDTS